MVSDQDLANTVESLFRHSNNPNQFTTLNSVIQHLESKLGLDLSHKAGFIRDHIQLLFSHPPPSPHSPHHQHHHPQPPPPPPPPQRDHHHFAHHPQFQNTHSQIPSHFALHHQQQQQRHHYEELNFQRPPHPHQHHHPNLQLHHHHHPNAPSHPLQFQQQQQSRSHPQTQKNVKTTETPPTESAPPKRRAGTGGLNKVCGVSPELEAIVGSPTMPRTEIVKQLWAYIRKHNLQDPSNKRKIICNDELRLVFETDSTDMFKMNKLLSKHIIRLEPPKEEGPDKKRAKLEVESTSESNVAGSSPDMMSEALAKFFDSESREMPQTEALRRVWEYIQVNHLEDPTNSMVVICDSKLQELFGCESISALGVTEMLESHFVKQS